MIVRVVLANRFPMLLWWGPDYIQIYNDAYAPILGAKHPRQALGRPFRECWHEVFDVLGPLVDVPFNGGPATWMDDIELIVRRHGFAEESHFTIAYSSVPDDEAPKGIGGVLGTVMEITQKVIGERRLQILSELGARVVESRSAENACRQAINVLAEHPKDVPFALVYLFDESGDSINLAGASGWSAATGAAHLEAPQDELARRIAECARAGALQLHDLGEDLLLDVPVGPWPEPPHQLALVPLRSATSTRPAGVLVAGISACIRPDAQYTRFLDLVAGKIASSVANARAYEEERRRAEALAQIDRAKTIFFSNVSHEFRTPLTLMLGPLEDALGNDTLPAPLRAQLDLANRNAQRLLKLVNSLLNFARIEAGRMTASFTPVDLASLTRDVASSFRSAMERAGLAFNVDVQALDEPVHVDRAMWEQVVLNLLSNAFKFTFDGSVTVRLRRDGGFALLEVSDTGGGIPGHELPRLFERFHRIEGMRSRSHEGSGIGLALVQELVRLHGGSIEVDSAPGSGSTFRVRVALGTAHIPPAQRTAEPSSSMAVSSDARAYVDDVLRWLPGEEAGPGAQADAGGELLRDADSRFQASFGARILLADDNADMRAYLRNLLAVHYEVLAVGDGEEALARARAEPPDLILADVMMPRLDGLALLARLRSDPVLHEVPVMLLSARAGEESRIEALAAGADDYVYKPFHARELLTRIGSLLELIRQRRQGEARFRAYMQATHDAVYRMSSDWREMRQLHGRNFIADEEGPSHAWMQKYIHPDDRAAVQAAIAKAIASNSPFELEHRVIRVDGSLGWTLSRAIPLHDERGQIVEWFGAAADVTERRQAQEDLLRHGQALEAADRQKDEFLAMLAHELRNPLAPMRSATELLLRTSLESSRSRWAVDIIGRQVTHLTRLVDDLLDISRITQGRIQLRLAPQRIDQLINHSLDSVAPLMREKRHSVVLRPSADPLSVMGDPERLVQCFSNVLVNAAKYTPSGGEICVRSGIDGDQAVITISDDGVGISADVLPRVFDLFSQGERTLDRSQGGLGIGLAVVKRLVEMHGGTVSARSEGVGKGATFEIRLARISDSGEAVRSEPATAKVARRILVVDDNRDGADALAELLQAEGHEVSTAYSSIDALQLQREFKPDTALLDVGLPEIDGYELARRMRAQQMADPLRLIAISGYGRERDQEEARRAGFSSHLLKPVDIETLERLLASPIDLSS
ncbi:ATP-binding protein [Paucibacter sp. R3-3]|uniref:histidine kinase n=1 Tax=Roseateles agri TaxID=3098619 RepID=A0ABU5DN30_9BURK|nr:ATP-binding protein [Paucibacter sp. R3-3]MDY0747724.1 ATP-binding protein [Paucibacter sp. R3-3]